jgi:glucan 1,3-beta-glucosidase
MSEYTCADGAQTPPSWKVSGTSLGGFLVLEPWLTPSLFYQFLGADTRWGPDIEQIELHTGMDQFTFCRALGPAEANRQLRRHWRLWVREAHIAAIAATGANTVRIPVGDWMFAPYGPYAAVENGTRCNDGALEQLDRVLGLLHKHGLKAELDMHAWVGSQNGLDNSGRARSVTWASQYQDHTFAPIGTFNHWSSKSWDWLISSDVDPATSWADARANGLINAAHWNHTITVLTQVVHRYARHPAVWGLSPVNEVGLFTPMDVLRGFYWEAYWLVRRSAPHWIFVMDASFRGGEVGGGGFMAGCRNKALDKHPYHAWAPWGQIETYYERSCGWGDESVSTEEEIGFAVIAGEWSLALDTCAMW